jgi:hypothetical protein
MHHASTASPITRAVACRRRDRRVWSLCTDPFTFVGGLPPIRAKQTECPDLKLAKGNYAAVCFVTDPATGKSHLELGMITPFTIA